MKQEIVKKLAKKQVLKSKKIEEEWEKLSIINRCNLHTRHFRTQNHGNITVLHTRVLGSRYEYQVQFSFCSPDDTFCKRHGRLEAFGNKVFTLYHPEEYLTDDMILDFLKYISNNSTVNSRNRYGFERFFGFPRWLPEFLYNYSINRDKKHWVVVGNPNGENPFYNRYFHSRAWDE